MHIPRCAACCCMQRDALRCTCRFAVWFSWIHQMTAEAATATPPNTLVPLLIIQDTALLQGTSDSVLIRHTSQHGLPLSNHPQSPRKK